jgi:ABC-2 type transport system permease protein
MTLLRLELLRMTRTHRWLALVGIYVFFGVLGPVTARYIGELLERFGTGDIVIEAPDPRPVDGIAQFIGNTSQLGLLAVVVVAAAALALDARPEVAAFLRTRVDRAGTLLLPRFAVVAATAALALVAGTAVAWALTGALLGGVSAGAMVVGTLLGMLYLVFAVAVVGAVAAALRGVPAIALGSLGVLILLPIVGLVPAIEVWLPSHLLAAVAGLVDGGSAGDYLRATLVTLAVTPVLVGFAMWRADRREL